MSGITSIGAASTATRKPFVLAAPAIPQSPQSALAAARQEATETLATTRQEAARGDQIAIRKLAQLQQAQKARQTFHVLGAPNPVVKNDGNDDAATESTNAATPENTTNASITRGFGLDAQA